jgi:glycolate dehydrogenase FAD-binding subunit
MTATFRPETPDQVADAIQTAVIEARQLEVIAHGSKRAWGRPADAGDTLDMRGLAGIIAYEPEELVLTAKPATPLAEIEAMLALRHQHLAFEPANLGPVLNCGETSHANAGGSLGGAVLCNLAGSRRIKAGAARDHVLGFHGVSGRGERFKAGGRVVKNVTGFDLSKLIAGSFGTLAAITELTVRALPAPDDTRTIVVRGLDDTEGIRALTCALSSTCDASGAAHLPADVAASSTVTAIAAQATPATLLRLEGPAPSVAFRAAELARLLRSFGEVAMLDSSESLALWREVRDVAYFAARRERQVWRLSVPPATGDAVVQQIFARLVGEAFYDWGGGLIWLAVSPVQGAGEAIVRTAAGLAGGHATLIRADASVREQVAVFQPQPVALAALTRRVKDSFDPHRVLNPGRMYADV